MTSPFGNLIPICQLTVGSYLPSARVKKLFNFFKFGRIFLSVSNFQEFFMFHLHMKNLSSSKSQKACPCNSRVVRTFYVDVLPMSQCDIQKYFISVTNVRLHACMCLVLPPSPLQLFLTYSEISSCNHFCKIRPIRLSV